jgi:ribosomal protein S18 acetylase RimI-like enzyme
MKKILSPLLAVFLCTVGSLFISMQSSILPIEQSRSFSIEVFNQYSPLKHEVIDELLSLQWSLIIPLQLPIPEENAKNGFLLIPMTPQYVHGLLDQKQGLIVCAYAGESLVGYVLLVDISEFKELYEDGNLGYIETTRDLERLKMAFSQSNIGYIEQIGVRAGYTRMGIGTELINACKKIKPGGLVADVFLEPLKNEASLQFFSRQGFEKSGTLYQFPRESFPHAHRTQVFLQSPFL